LIAKSGSIQNTPSDSEWDNAVVGGEKGKKLTSELESLRVFVEIFAAHAKSSDVIISSSLPLKAESMTMQQQI